MRSDHPQVFPLFAVLTALLLVTGAPLWGQTLQAEDDSIAIFHGNFFQQIPATRLLGNDQMPQGSLWSLTKEPSHGSWAGNPTDGFTFSPDPEFWSLGADSLIYTLEGPQGAVSTATVILYAGPPFELLYEEDFEGPDWNQTLQTLGVANGIQTQQTAIAGNSSLELSVQDSAQVGIEFEDPGPEPTGNTDAGRAGGLIDDSRDRWEALARVTLIEIGEDVFGPSDGKVRLVYDFNRQIHAEVWDEQQERFIPTPPIDLVSETPEVWVNWAQADEYVTVWAEADGRLAGPVVGYNPEPVAMRVAFGMFPIGSVPPVTLFLDDVSVWRTHKTGRHMPDLFKEDFESGSITADASVVGSGISIQGDAAQTGEYGMEVDLNAGNSQLRTTWETQSETLALRFNVDASHFQTGTHANGSAEMFTFFGAGADPTNFGDLNIRLFLKEVNGTPHLAAHAFADTGSPQAIGWRPVGDQFEVLLKLQISSSDSFGNGFFQLWIDGQLEELFHIPNGARLPLWSHFGAKGVDAETTGFLRFDDLVIWH